jgi:hypothetical protein
MRSYDHNHPKGTKYTPGELREHRDIWYAQCAQSPASVNTAPSSQIVRPQVKSSDASEFLTLAWQMYADFGELTEKVKNGTQNNDLGMRLQDKLSCDGRTFHNISQRLCIRYSDNPKVLDTVKLIHEIIRTMMTEKHDLREQLGPAIVAAETALALS